MTFMDIIGIMQKMETLNTQRINGSLKAVCLCGKGVLMGIRYRHGIALVKDVAASKHFYADIIGLAIEKDFDSMVLFKDDFAIHSAEIFYGYLNKPYHGEKMGHDNVDFYFTTDNLEEFQQKLKDEKVSFIHEIRLHDWGERVIRVYDPDGHIVEIGDADGE